MDEKSSEMWNWNWHSCSKESRSSHRNTICGSWVRNPLEHARCKSTRGSFTLVAGLYEIQCVSESNPTLTLAQRPDWRRFVQSCLGRRSCGHLEVIEKSYYSCLYRNCPIGLDSHRLLLKKLVKFSYSPDLYCRPKQICSVLWTSRIDLSP